MTGKAWIIFDGRAACGDTDDASVLEFAGTSRREVRSALAFWRGSEGVLVEYDDDGRGNLRNERVVGMLEEGIGPLMRKCFGDGWKVPERRSATSSESKP